MNNKDKNDELAGASVNRDGLYAILYVSTAARPLSLDELKLLQARAQGRNLRESVTGVLLYSDGTFMQYLEGPSKGLAEVYDIVKADPNHYGIIDLVREPIAQREFSEWPMALRVVGARGLTSEALQDALLAQKLDRSARPESASREQLRRFWNRGRNSVASTLHQFASERARRVTQVRADWTSEAHYDGPALPTRGPFQRPRSRLEASGGLGRQQADLIVSAA